MHSFLLISLITLAVLGDFSALSKPTEDKKDLLPKSGFRHLLFRKIRPVKYAEESSDAGELDEKIKAEDADETEEKSETEEKVKKADTDEVDEKSKTEETDELAEKIKEQDDEDANKAIAKDKKKVTKTKEDKKGNKIGKKIDKVKGDGGKVKGIKEKSTESDSSEDSGDSSASSTSPKPKGECAKVGTSKVCLSEDGKSLIVTDKKVKPVIFMTEKDSGNPNPIKEAADDGEAGSGGGAGGKTPGPAGGKAVGVSVGGEPGSGGIVKGSNAGGNSFSFSTGTGGNNKVAVSQGGGKINKFKPNFDIQNLTNEIKKGILGKVPGLGSITNGFGGLAGASGSNAAVSTSGGKGSSATAMIG